LHAVPAAQIEPGLDGPLRAGRDDVLRRLHGGTTARGAHAGDFERNLPLVADDVVMLYDLGAFALAEVEDRLRGDNAGCGSLLEGGSLGRCLLRRDRQGQQEDQEKGGKNVCFHDSSVYRNRPGASSPLQNSI